MTENVTRADLVKWADNSWRLEKHANTYEYATQALAMPDDGSCPMHVLYEMLYWSSWYLGYKTESEEYWKKALKEQPTSFKYINSAHFYNSVGIDIADLTDKVRRGINFSFVKLGDGEQACMSGAPGATCDGQAYSTELCNGLHKAFNYLMDKVYVPTFDNQRTYNILLHRNDNDNQAVSEFWLSVRASNRLKCFIGPNKLKGAAEMLNAEHIVVNDHDAFSDYNTILELLRSRMGQSVIFIFCAGPASKVWISDLKQMYSEITCIDAGSAFDPIFLGHTRTDQLSQNECRELYASALIDADFNPTKKYGLKMLVDQFGNSVPEDYFDTSEKLCIEKFEEVCIKLKALNKIRYTMIELGSNQCYYSMLFRAIIDDASSNMKCYNIMVEPTDEYMLRGKKHFEYNGFNGEFVDRCIGQNWDGKRKHNKGSVTIDDLLEDYDLPSVDILHCDIDGNERTLLDTQEEAFSYKKIKYVFILTHDTHEYCKQKMLNWGYTILVDEPRKVVGSDGMLLFTSEPNFKTLIVTEKSFKHFPQHIHPENVFATKEVTRDQLVVDVGCGNHKTVPWAVGVDLFVPNVDVHASLDDLPVDRNTVDVIISRHSLEHCIDPIKALHEWYRVLKPGGKVVIILPDHNAIDTMQPIISCGTHLHAYNIASFRRLVNSSTKFTIRDLGIVVPDWSFGGVLIKTEEKI